jgi:hypothetical protein
LSGAQPVERCGERRDHRGLAHPLQGARGGADELIVVRTQRVGDERPVRRCAGLGQAPDRRFPHVRMRIAREAADDRQLAQRRCSRRGVHADFPHAVRRVMARQARGAGAFTRRRVMLPAHTGERAERGRRDLPRCARRVAASRRQPCRQCDPFRHHTTFVAWRSQPRDRPARDVRIGIARRAQQRGAQGRRERVQLDSYGLDANVRRAVLERFGDKSAGGYDEAPHLPVRVVNGPFRRRRVPGGRSAKRLRREPADRGAPFGLESRAISRR